MTKLDSMLKGRDITFPIKIHLVKTMLVPVVMYGCESRPIRKAEHQRIDVCEYSAGEDFKSPLDSKEITPVLPMNIQG